MYLRQPLLFVRQKEYIFRYEILVISLVCAKRNQTINASKMPAKKKAAEASASQEEDVSMADTSMVENGTPEAEEEITVDEHRIRIVRFIWPADLSYVC
jgi:hypothetical protein